MVEILIGRVRVVPGTMNFDQGELDFSGNGSEDGHRKWLRELEEKKRVFECRYGVIIGRRVRVLLAGESNPLEGPIYLVEENYRGPAGRLRLRLGQREFLSAEIESVVSLDDG